MGSDTDMIEYTQANTSNFYYIHIMWNKKYNRKREENMRKIAKEQKKKKQQEC